MLGDTAFTKEELAIKSIRDEAVGSTAGQNSNEERKVPASYQRHVDKMNHNAGIKSAESGSGN